MTNWWEYTVSYQWTCAFHFHIGYMIENAFLVGWFDTKTAEQENYASATLNMTCSLSVGARIDVSLLNSSNKYNTIIHAIHLCNPLLIINCP